jgi:hypothetical protein
VEKPDDHTYMMNWIAAFEELPHCEYKDEKGRTHSYRWQNTLPLNGKEDTVEVNWLEYCHTYKQSKTTLKIAGSRMLR